MSCLFRSLSILLRYKIGPIDVEKFRNYICDRDIGYNVDLNIRVSENILF